MSFGRLPTNYTTSLWVIRSEDSPDSLWLSVLNSVPPGATRKGRSIQASRTPDVRYLINFTEVRRVLAKYAKQATAVDESSVLSFDARWGAMSGNPTTLKIVPHQIKRYLEAIKRILELTETHDFSKTNHVLFVSNLWLNYWARPYEKEGAQPPVPPAPPARFGKKSGKKYSSSTTRRSRRRW